MQENLVKALVQGAGLGVVTRYMEPDATVLVPLVGQRYPLWLLAAIGAMGSSIASDIIHDQVLPHIPKNKKFMQAESAILSPAVAATVYLAILYFFQPDLISRIGVPKLAGEAIGAEMLAYYVVQNLL